MKLFLFFIFVVNFYCFSVSNALALDQLEYRWVLAGGGDSECRDAGYPIISTLANCQEALGDPPGIQYICCARQKVAPAPIVDGCCLRIYFGSGSSGEKLYVATAEKSNECTNDSKIPGSLIYSYSFLEKGAPSTDGTSCIAPVSGSSSSNNITGSSSTDTTASSTLPNFTKLTNPLGTTSIPVVIGRVVKAILLIIGSLAFLMFVYGGFVWMTAAGNEQKVETGRNTLIWATLGLIIIFSAYVLVKFLMEAIGAIPS